MSSLKPDTTLERLSEYLLRLGCLAREVPAHNFLGQALETVREWISFPRGWWGMGTDLGKGQIPSIHQSECIGLPDDYAENWRKISQIDSFSDAVREHIGQVQRWEGSEHDELPLPIQEFDRRYDLEHCMGLALDDTATGHGFFISIFRGKGQAAFCDEEARLFLHLMRHIVQLWHFSLQDALALASKEDIGHAALARADGRVQYAGQKLCELLYAQWPDWDGIRLPPEVVSRFASLPAQLRLAGGMLDLSAADEHVWLVRKRPGTSALLLSPREQRVAQLFAAGHSYKEIARLSGLTPATVRTYLRDAYLRLGVRNKIELGGALTDTS